MSTNYRPEITEAWFVGDERFSSYAEAHAEANAHQVEAMQERIAELESQLSECRESNGTYALTSQKLTHFNADLAKRLSDSERERQGAITETGVERKTFELQIRSANARITQLEHHNHAGDQRLKEAMEKLELLNIEKNAVKDKLGQESMENVSLRSMLGLGITGPIPSASVIELGPDDMIQEGDFVGSPPRPYVGCKVKSFAVNHTFAVFRRLTPNRPLPETA